MNKEVIDLLIKIFDKNKDLYNLFIKLSNEKDEGQRFSLKNQIKLVDQEIDDLLAYFNNQPTLISNVLEVLRQLNVNINLDDVFVLYNNEKTIILKKMYNDLTNMIVLNPSLFTSTLKGFFKKESLNEGNNNYLASALPSFKLETSLRTIEILSDDSNYNNIKYLLAYLNSELYILLNEYDFEEIPHYFNENTVLDTEIIISNIKKEMYKDYYGFLLFSKVCSCLLMVNDEIIVNYLKGLLRTSYMFMNDNTIYELLNHFKNSPLYDILTKEVVNRKKDLENANKVRVMLNDVTQDIIKKINDITKSIKNTYNCLMSMELEGKKETSYYQEMLDYLNLSLKEENELYVYFELYPDEVIDATDYVFETMNKNDYRYNNIDVALDNDENELILLRIAKKLNNLALNDDNYLYEEMQDDEVKICSTNFDFEFLKHTYKNYDNEFDYESLRLMDFENDQEQLTFKYNSAFLNDKIETELVKFKLNKMTCNLGDVLIEQSKSINNEVISFVNNHYAFSRLALIIDDIMEYTDDIISDDIEFDEYDEEKNDNDHNEFLDELTDELKDLGIDIEADTYVLDLFHYNLLIAQFKACIEFVNKDGLKEIKEIVDQKFKVYSEMRSLIFEELYNIIESQEDLKKEANKDLKQKKK